MTIAAVIAVGVLYTLTYMYLYFLYSGSDVYLYCLHGL